MSDIPAPESWGTSTFKDLQTLYAIYRDYTKHEDDLLNQRTTWFLLIQGFLFATYGVVGEWALGSGADPHYIERKWLVGVLAFVGFSIAAAAFTSIFAANNAIESLCVRWDLILRAYRSDTKNLLPALAGGGHKNAHKHGKLPAVLIPIIVAIAWLTIAGMAWREYEHPLQTAIPYATHQNAPSPHRLSY